MLWDGSMSADQGTPLHELADLTVGHVGSMASEYVDVGVPFLRSQNIRPFRLDLNDVKYVSAAFHERLTKSALRPKDVVVVRTGTPGTAAVVPEGLGPVNCADLVVIRPGPQLDSRYLCYFINGAAKGYVDSRLVGAVQQHFNVGAAREMIIPPVSLHTQQAIGEVLGALDDAIEADRLLMERSEQLAHALVKTVEPSVALASVAEFQHRMISPTTFAEALVDHFSLPAYDEGRLPARVIGENIKSGKLVLEDRMVLVSKLNPHIPRVWLASPADGVRSLASTEFIPLTPSTDFQVELLWAICSEPRFCEQLVELVRGTTGSHQRVAAEDVLNVLVASPNGFAQGTLDAIRSSVAFADALRRESSRLAELRDALLPKLLSGELRVSDGQDLVSGAA